MTQAEVIALVALGISGGGLAVQVNREWRTWATRVKVKVQPRSLAEAGQPSKPIVLFTITNRSDHPVKITHLGMEPITKGGKSIFFAAPLPVGGPGPYPVPPHDSIQLYQPVESFSDGDPDHKTRAPVMTSDDKTVRSKRVRVRNLTG